MKSFLTGFSAAIIGAIGFIFLFFRKGGGNISISTSEMKKKDAEADKLKSEIKVLDDKIGKPVEDKSLESELDYWNKEKK